LVRVKKQALYFGILVCSLDIVWTVTVTKHLTTNFPFHPKDKYMHKRWDEKKRRVSALLSVSAAVH